MDYVESYLGKFQITGISVRVSNLDGNAPKAIGALWKRFYDENLYSKIPNKVSDDIYCAYYEYSGENHTEYTTLLGCKTAGNPDSVDGFLSVLFPESRYFVYRASGDLPQSVIKAWDYVWKENLLRTFTGDFDLYPSDSIGGNKSEILIHVAIKDY